MATAGSFGEEFGQPGFDEGHAAGAGAAVGDAPFLVQENVAGDAADAIGRGQLGALVIDVGKGKLVALDESDGVGFGSVELGQSDDAHAGVAECFAVS